MLILAIETSCDETSLALVEAKGGLRAPRFTIVKNLIASQIETHRPWGGVVPNLAKREHLQNLPILFKKINLQTYKLINLKIIAVTVGPGMEPCLWTGINFAEEIQKQHFPKTKIIGVNHLHGHAYSFLLDRNLTTRNSQLTTLFPAVQLIASGGHTILLLMQSLARYKKLGETRDDAAGECFDKVARMLELPYPGGPEIEKLATHGNPSAIHFPRPMIHAKNYDFSFSGLKTAVLYHLKQISPLHFTEGKSAYVPYGNSRSPAELGPRPMAGSAGRERRRSSAAGADEPPMPVGTSCGLPLNTVHNIVASFQRAATETLVTKTIRAAKEYGAQSVILSGGVAANKALRRELRAESKKIGAGFLSAPTKYHGDNAAMIAVAGHITKLLKIELPLKANGTLEI